MSAAAAALLPLLLLTLAWSAHRFARLAGPLARARPEYRLDRPGERAWGVVTSVLGHARLLRRPYAGVLPEFKGPSQRCWFPGRIVVRWPAVLAPVVRLACAPVIAEAA